MQFMAMVFICALAVATLAPAPSRNEDRLLLSLLGTVFVAIVVMGVLALLDVLTGTAILAAIGASIMVPCAWLARAPGADFDDADEDDDGGGSPPYEPSPWDGPDDRRPEPTPAPVFSFAMGPQAPVSTRALAPAGPRAELPPPGAVPPPNPRFPLGVTPPWSGAVAQAPFEPPLPDAPAPPAPAAQPLNPRFPLITTAPWSEPRTTAPWSEPRTTAPWSEPRPPYVLEPPADLPLEPARDPEQRRSRLRRGDHRSIAHRPAAGPHEGRRRRGVMRLRLLHGWRRRRRLTCVGDAEPATPVDAPR
jgi:hypothetical protein